MQASIAEQKLTDAKAGLQLWLKRLRLRSPLDPDDEDRVASLPGRLERICPNRDFVQLGETSHEVCLVVNGLAARFGQTRDGIRQLSALHLPGEVADLHASVLPKACCALTAMSELLVYRIPHAAINEAAEQSPRLARAFWRDCSVDAAISAEWLLNIGRRSAVSRLAHLLCELALRRETIGGDRQRFTLGLTQTQLADALALTSVHVNRTVRRLREEGAARISGGEVQMLDWKLLMQLGDFDPTYLHLCDNPVA